MIDRALFLCSRFLWPAHTLLLLTAIGLASGQQGLALYTYALALTAPLYFTVGYGFPLYLLTSVTEPRYSHRLLYLRLASALATIPIVVLASLALPSTQGYVVAALWLVKVGEIVFEPLPATIAADIRSPFRGRRLFALEIFRVAIVQALVWYSLLAAEWGLVRTLALAGGTSVLISTVLLWFVPDWSRDRNGKESYPSVLREFLRRATPMTASGALLALLVSLPRLLAEPSLGEAERAIFGVAQVFSSGIAVLFHAIWLYELHHIRSGLESQKAAAAIRRNLGLSLKFTLVLTAGVIALFFIQPHLLAVLNVQGGQSRLLAALFAVLGLQHCVSVHRDILKFTGQQWREVEIVVIALVVFTATFYLMVYGLAMHWLWGTVVACIVAAAIQVALGILWIRRADLRQADREPIALA